MGAAGTTTAPPCVFWTASCGPAEGDVCCWTGLVVVDSWGGTWDAAWGDVWPPGVGAGVGVCATDCAGDWVCCSGEVVLDTGDDTDARGAWSCGGLCAPTGAGAGLCVVGTGLTTRCWTGLCVMLLASGGGEDAGVATEAAWVGVCDGGDACWFSWGAGDVVCTAAGPCGGGCWKPCWAVGKFCGVPWRLWGDTWYEAIELVGPWKLC